MQLPWDSRLKALFHWMEWRDEDISCKGLPPPVSGADLARECPREIDRKPSSSLYTSLGYETPSFLSRHLYIGVAHIYMTSLARWRRRCGGLYETRATYGRKLDSACTKTPRLSRSSDAISTYRRTDRVHFHETPEDWMFVSTLTASKNGGSVALIYRKSICRFVICCKHY